MSTNEGVPIPTNNPLYKRIRLLRKKLKQIETLKLLPRKLNDEEVAKIGRQDDFRDELLDLLLEQAEQERVAEEEKASQETVEFSDPSEDERAPDLTESEDSTQEDGDKSTKDVSPKQIKVDVVTPPEKGSSPRKGDVVASAAAEKPAAKKEPVKSPAKPVDPLMTMRKSWSNRYFDLLELTGHTDIIRSVDISAEYILSSSRDTSVKLWNTVTGELIQNLGGHRDQVNCVKLIQVPEGEKTNTLVVSGSEDCSIRFWDITSGAQVKEFYVYNSVSCFTLLNSGRYLVAGLAGGKLEVYDIHSLNHLLSWTLLTDRVTCLSSQEKLVAVGGSDGLVTVLEIDGETLKCLYTLEECSVGSVNSLLLTNGHVVVGDDESNVKLINWRHNRVSAIANHHSEFGVTDALCMTGSYLLSSAYDYDSGVGYINVRDASQHKYDYITSMTDSEVMHILTMAALGDGTSSPLTVVTGGIQLVLWREDVTKSVDSVRCKSRKLLLADDHLLSESDDYDSESEVTESEEEDLDEQSEEGGGAPSSNITRTTQFNIYIFVSLCFVSTSSVQQPSNDLSCLLYLQ